ncbi:GNAT family N-acetyltransferase [Streptomyces sp. A7024]|uniref:GNAT family N-acetyltransferase n=1 Tax=Streptomyces coryli TaxID=1128680 RepID=A0A6G4UCM3_9ACTN|nr:GNAT family N-acetyltransferase [Streptomyces coryli]NGN69128.1 GNAT family N-acetyltransferase [Streptomyces coryli]
MPELTQPAIPPGTLTAGPQPALPVPGDGDLHLRPWQDTDAPAVLAAYQDEAIIRWHARRLDSADEAAGLIKQWRDGWAAGTAAQWAIARTTDDACLGRMALRLMDLHEGTAEIGYWIAPTARGTAVAPRALTTMTEWAVAAGFHRLDLLHSTGNAASCRVAEKSGYPLEGTRRSSALHTDGWHDMHVHTRIQA